MKKPNITPGTWTIERRNPYTTGVAHMVGSGYRIATFYKFGFDEHTEHNAKAVSAVPEMIDALMAIYNEGSSEFATFQASELGKQIKTALRNAGVITEDE